MTAAEIVQIVIGALSLVATVAVSFLIYWLQHRHELEIERAEQKKQDEILEQEAHEFLIKNEKTKQSVSICHGVSLQQICIGMKSINAKYTLIFAPVLTSCKRKF